MGGRKKEKKNHIMVPLIAAMHRCLGDGRRTAFVCLRQRLRCSGNTRLPRAVRGRTRADFRHKRCGWPYDTCGRLHGRGTPEFTVMASSGAGPDHPDRGHPDVDPDPNHQPRLPILGVPSISAAAGDWGGKLRADIRFFSGAFQICRGLCASRPKATHSIMSVLCRA